MINRVASPWASTAFAKEAASFRLPTWQFRLAKPLPSLSSFTLLQWLLLVYTKPQLWKKTHVCKVSRHPARSGGWQKAWKMQFQTSEACGCYEVSGFFEAVFPAFDDDNGYFFCEVVMWAASRNLALWPQHSIHRLAHGCTYHSSAEEGVFNQATCAICQEVHPQCLCLEWP